MGVNGIKGNRSPAKDSTGGLRRLAKYLVPLFIILSLQVASPAQGQSILGIQELRDYRTAIGLLKSNDLDLAEKQYRDFIETYQGSDRLPGAYFGLAETHYLRNQHDTASKYYLKSLTTGSLSEEYQSAALTRGLDSTLKGNNLELTQQYLNGIEKYGEEMTEESKRRLVQLLERTDKKKRALQVAKKYSRNDSDDYWRYEVGLINASLDRNDTAIEILHSLADTHGQYQNNALYTIGEIYYEEKSYDSAAEYYSKLKNDTVLQHRAKYGLAWISIERRDISQAKTILKSITGTDNDRRGQAARDLARLFRSEQGFDTAGQWYERSIRWMAPPDKSEVKIEYANYLVHQDRMAEAIPYYESAQNLPLEASRNLTKAYLHDHRYHEALQSIRDLQHQEKLQEPIWDLHEAVALYRLGQFQDALFELPDDSSVDENELQNRIRLLRGSLHYRLRDWQKAKESLKSVNEDYSRWKSQYFLSLIDEKLESPEQARQSLEGVLAKNPPEKWKNRIHYQMARINYLLEDYQSYESNMAVVEPEKFPRILRFENRLLQFGNRLRSDTSTEMRLNAQTLLDTAARFNLELRWFNYISSVRLDDGWWDELLLPALKSHAVISDNHGVDTIRLLRKRGYSTRSERLGKHLVDKYDSSTMRRQARSELLITLYEARNYQTLARYFPDRSNWDKWQPPLLRSLGLTYANYYHETENPEKGLAVLKDLKNRHDPLGNPLDQEFREWMSSFELKLNRFKSVRNRLSSIGEGNLSPSAKINLSVAEYHLGDTTTSYKRLTSIRNNQNQPSITLYRYGMRFLRDSKNHERLIEWSDDLLETYLLKNTAVKSSLLKNVRTLINDDKNRMARSFISRASKTIPDSSTKIPFKYYKGITYFNEDKLDKSSSIFNQLKQQYDLNKKWKKRIHKQLIESHLRLDNWLQAYGNWKELKSTDFAGKNAGRLLDSTALQEYPDQFGEFLLTVRKDYHDYVPEEALTYWFGRLREKIGRFGPAIRNYEKYLDSDWENRKKNVALRLVRLYKETGRTDQAKNLYERLNQWTDDPVYRLRQAVQLRKLGELDRAETILQELVSKERSLKAQAHYDLALVELQRDNKKRAKNHFKSVLDSASTSDDWVRDARKWYVNLSLDLGHTEDASSAMNGLNDELTKRLFEMEYNRQKNELDTAVNIMNDISREQLSSDTFNARRYRKYASKLYWQTDNYKQFLDVFSGPPEQTAQRYRYVIALLRSNRLEEARKLRNQLPADYKDEAEYRFADYHYKNKNWDNARRLYRKTSESLPGYFKLGDIYRETGNETRALKTWSRGLEYARRNKESDTRWVDPIVQGILKVTPSLDSWERSRTILRKNWDLPFEDQFPVAVKGVTWSLEEDDRTTAKYFLDRINPESTREFLTIAEILEENGTRPLLEQWIDSSLQNMEDDTYEVGYYQILRQMRLDKIDEISPKTINSYINKAVSQNSTYGPKLQALLGDYYFHKENYEQAAIEYRKVEILFDSVDLSPDKKLRLAKSYEKLDKTTDARNVYTDLTADTLPAELQKEAEQWLEAHSNSS